MMLLLLLSRMSQSYEKLNPRPEDQGIKLDQEECVDRKL